MKSTSDKKNEGAAHAPEMSEASIADDEESEASTARNRAVDEIFRRDTSRLFGHLGVRSKNTAKPIPKLKKTARKILQRARIAERREDENTSALDRAVSSLDEISEADSCAELMESVSSIARICANERDGEKVRTVLSSADTILTRINRHVAEWVDYMLNEAWQKDVKQNPENYAHITPLHWHVIQEERNKVKRATPLQGLVDPASSPWTDEKLESNANWQADIDDKRHKDYVREEERNANAPPDRSLLDIGLQVMETTRFLESCFTPQMNSSSGYGAMAAIKPQEVTEEAPETEEAPDNIRRNTENGIDEGYESMYGSASTINSARLSSRRGRRTSATLLAKGSIANANSTNSRNPRDTHSKKGIENLTEMDEGFNEDSQSPCSVVDNFGQAQGSVRSVDRAYSGVLNPVDHYDYASRSGSTKANTNLHETTPMSSAKCAREIVSIRELLASYPHHIQQSIIVYAMHGDARPSQSGSSDAGAGNNNLEPHDDAAQVVAPAPTEGDSLAEVLAESVSLRGDGGPIDAAANAGGEALNDWNNLYTADVSGPSSAANANGGAAAAAPGRLTNTHTPNESTGARGKTSNRAQNNAGVPANGGVQTAAQGPTTSADSARPVLTPLTMPAANQAVAGPSSVPGVQAPHAGAGARPKTGDSAPLAGAKIASVEASAGGPALLESNLITWPDAPTKSAADESAALLSEGGVQGAVQDWDFLRNLGVTENLRKWNGGDAAFKYGHHKLGKEQLCATYLRLPQDKRAEFRRVAGLSDNATLLDIARLGFNIISARITGSEGQERYVESNNRIDDPMNNPDYAHRRDDEVLQDYSHTDTGELTPRSEQCKAIVFQVIKPAQQRENMGVLAPNNSVGLLNDEEARILIDRVELGTAWHQELEVDPSRPSYDQGGIWQENNGRYGKSPVSIVRNRSEQEVLANYRHSLERRREGEARRRQVDNFNARFRKEQAKRFSENPEEFKGDFDPKSKVAAQKFVKELDANTRQAYMRRLVGKAEFEGLEATDVDFDFIYGVASATKEQIEKRRQNDTANKKKSKKDKKDKKK